MKDSYVYILADDVAAWVSNNDRGKHFITFQGLTAKGVAVYEVAIRAIADDPDTVRKNGVLYSSKSLDELQEIAHKAVEGF